MLSASPLSLEHAITTDADACGCWPHTVCRGGGQPLRWYSQQQLSICICVQIRNGLAIATALNRTLIMPELWCGLDRWWAPHTGIIPGSDTELPFLCPMDHIFDLEV